MKTYYATAVLSIALALPALSQGQDEMPYRSPPPPAFTSEALPDPSAWANTAIDWFSSVREFPQSITNNQSGEVTLQVRRVIAVGGGLNYLDSTGAWQQSQDLIELTPDGGAEALKAPNKVFFNPTLSSTAGIKIITRSNLVFTACPVGVYYYDPTTGKQQLLAALQPGVAGKYLPPNRIVYPSAFHSGLLDADVRITVTKDAVECDTIITHQPKATPQTFSMDPSTTLLQVRHAWTSSTPPTMVVGQTTAGGVSDTSIDFGDMLFAKGRAFAWDGGVSTDTNTPAQINFVSNDSDEPVSKTWQNGTPITLTESVLWANVQPKLAQLPLMAKLDRGSSKNGKKSIELASTPAKSPGFVLDWILVSGSGSYTFATYNPSLPNTYWLQSSATFNGTVTFNSNCIIKRAPGTTLTAAGNSVGNLVCNGTCTAPSIITEQDDNMYGENTGTNCASTDTAVALVDDVRGANVTGMNIRYAGTGIAFYGECCTDNRTFKDSTIESCQTGAYANACNITIPTGQYFGAWFSVVSFLDERL